MIPRRKDRMMNKNILRNLIDYLIFIILGAAHGTLYWKLMMYTANYKSVKLMYASIIGMTVVTFLVVMITVKVIKVKWPALKCLCGFIMSEIAAIGFIRFNYIQAVIIKFFGMDIIESDKAYSCYL